MDSMAFLQARTAFLAVQALEEEVRKAAAKAKAAMEAACGHPPEFVKAERDPASGRFDGNFCGRCHAWLDD